MRLTQQLLDAIITMASVVEAGSVDDYLGYSNDESTAMYADALKAGDWAAQEQHRRQIRRVTHVRP